MSGPKGVQWELQQAAIRARAALEQARRDYWEARLTARALRAEADVVRATGVSVPTIQDEAAALPEGTGLDRLVTATTAVTADNARIRRQLDSAVADGQSVRSAEIARQAAAGAAAAEQRSTAERLAAGQDAGARAAAASERATAARRETDAGEAIARQREARTTASAEPRANASAEGDAPSPTAASVSSRIERYLGGLEPAAALDSATLALVARAGAARPEEADALADRIRLAVGVANREVLERAALRDRVRSLRAALGSVELSETPLDLELSTADTLLGAPGSGAPPVSIAAIRDFAVRVDAAVDRSRQDADRRQVGEILSAGLAELGYATAGTAQTLVGRDGVLVARDTWSTHALEVVVTDGELRLEVVRTADAPDPQRARGDDAAIEDEFCADYPLLLAHLERSGMRPRRGQEVPAGLVPPRRVELLDALPEDTRPSDTAGASTATDRRRSARRGAAAKQSGGTA